MDDQREREREGGGREGKIKDEEFRREKRKEKQEKEFTWRRIERHLRVKNRMREGKGERRDDTTRVGRKEGSTHTGIIYPFVYPLNRYHWHLFHAHPLSLSLLSSLSRPSELPDITRM